MAHVYALCALFTSILDIVPLIWQIQHRNTAATFLCLWLMIRNTFGFVNAIIWPNFSAAWLGWDGKGYCDFQIRLNIIADIGMFASLFMISRTLAITFRKKTVLASTREEVIRRRIIEIFGVLVFPMLISAFHYVVQPNRYYIIAEAGCWPSVDNSWPSFIIFLGWPSILTLGSMIYIISLLWSLICNQKDRDFIRNFRGRKDIDAAFKRLYMISIIFLAIFLPSSIYILVLQASVPLLPYSWKAIHDPSTWNIIYPLPITLPVEFLLWMKVASGMILFLMFGIGHESGNIYWDILRFFRCQNFAKKFGERFGHYKNSVVGSMDYIAFNTTSSSRSWSRKENSETGSLLDSPVSFPNEKPRYGPFKDGFVQFGNSFTSCRNAVTQIFSKSEKKSESILPVYHKRQNPTKRSRFYPWISDRNVPLNRSPSLQSFRHFSLPFPRGTRFVDTFGATSLRSVAESVAVTLPHRGSLLRPEITPRDEYLDAVIEIPPAVMIRPEKPDLSAAFDHIVDIDMSNTSWFDVESIHKPESDGNETVLSRPRSLSSGSSGTSIASTIETSYSVHGSDNDQFVIGDDLSSEDLYEASLSRVYELDSEQRPHNVTKFLHDITKKQVDPEISQLNSNRNFVY